MNKTKKALLASFAALLAHSANADILLSDFESGYPDGFFSYTGDIPATDVLTTAGDASADARPGQVGDNTFLDVSYDFSMTFGGVGIAFALPGGPQDWSSLDALSFWMLGSGDLRSYQIDIFDNRSDPSADTSERFDTVFTDDVAGWSEISLSFSDFSRATDFQPGGAPDDGFGLTEIWGFAIVMDGNSGRLGFDDIRVNAVPEPGALALLGFGLLGMLLLRRRKPV